MSIWEYRISANSFRGNYSFLKLMLQKLFKGGKYSKEETIFLSYFFVGIYNLNSCCMVCTIIKHSLVFSFFFYSFGQGHYTYSLLSTYILTTFLEYWLLIANFNIKWDNYSRAETNQGRKLLIFRRFWLRKLFKGGNFSREESIQGRKLYEEIR